MKSRQLIRLASEGHRGARREILTRAETTASMEWHRAAAVTKALPVVISGMTTRARAAYIREMFSEHEPIITDMISRLARKTHGKAAGLEFKLKKVDKLHEKLVKKGRDYKPRDVLRYTIVYDPSIYYESVAAAMQRLESLPYLRTKPGRWIKTTWCQSDMYKGINTSWVMYTAERFRDGECMKQRTVAFELQFHTKESLNAKEVNHNLYDIYERSRCAQNQSLTCRSIKEKMLKINSKVTIPKGLRTEQTCRQTPHTRQAKA